MSTLLKERARNIHLQVYAYWRAMQRRGENTARFTAPEPGDTVIDIGGDPSEDMLEASIRRVGTFKGWLDEPTRQMSVLLLDRQEVVWDDPAFLAVPRVPNIGE